MLMSRLRSAFPIRLAAKKQQMQRTKMSTLLPHRLRLIKGINTYTSSSDRWLAYSPLQTLHLDDVSPVNDY